MRGLVVLYLFAISALGQEYNPVAKERAPDSVLGLPAGIRRDLSKRQCLIPKYFGDVRTMYGAYTKGHFHSGASVDYAVVCHIPARKIQNVLVYSDSEGVWNGEVIERTPFDPAPHSSGRCEASVGAATSKYILDHTRAYAPEELKHLPRLDHNGIDVSACEKGSVIYYFHEGKWLQLAGAD